MKKKMLALVLAVTMIGTALAGCGSNDTTEKAAETTAGETTDTDTTEAAGETTEAGAAAVDLKEYKIALPMPDSGLTSFSILANNLKILGNLTNGTFVHQFADLTADGCISFVESQIAAGADGLLIIPPADSVLPTITTLCEEAGVYWGISYRNILDEEIKATVEASKYYVGNCYENEEEAGYDVMKYLGEQGMKKVAIISTTKGDTTGDAREIGLNKAAEEYGMEVAAEARGLTQAADATSAVESFLSANADLDCVFVVASAATGLHEAVVKAIQDAGRDETVKMATIDFPDEMGADFESGVQIIANGLPCFTYDPYILAIKLVNAIQGYPLSDDSFTTNNIAMLAITDTDAANKYIDVLGNENFTFYEESFITENLLKWNNQELDEASLQAFIDSYSPY